MPSSSDAVLAGMVVICTGGGSGIGRAAVEAFVAAGARVGVLERDAVKAAALAELGGEMVVVNGDATSATANTELVALTMDRWRRIDVAVTFVGVFDLYTPLIDVADDRFDAVFEEMFTVNVKSPLLTARAATPALRRSKGSLIFTLSSSSFYAGRGGTLYVSSKFAMRGAVKQLAHELAPHVRVNGVAPGGTVGTDLRGPRSLGLGDVRLDDRPGRADQISARTPLNVALTPADHAALYVFLASRASMGMTGEILRSDGGIGVR